MSSTFIETNFTFAGTIDVAVDPLVGAGPPTGFTGVVGAAEGGVQPRARTEPQIKAKPN